MSLLETPAASRTRGGPSGQELVLRATLAWVPLTHELIGVPQGNVATTPSIWLGASIGMSLEL